MKPKIQYFKDPSEFLSPYKHKGRFEEILKTIEYFDYAGGIVIPRKEVEDNISLFPVEIKDSLEGLCMEKDGLIHYIILKDTQTFTFGRN